MTGNCFPFSFGFKACFLQSREETVSWQLTGHLVLALPTIEQIKQSPYLLLFSCQALMTPPFVSTKVLFRVQDLVHITSESFATTIDGKTWSPKSSLESSSLYNQKPIGVLLKEPIKKRMQKLSRFIHFFKLEIWFSNQENMRVKPDSGCLRCPTVLVQGGTPFNLEVEGGSHFWEGGSHSLTALLALPPPSFTPIFSITWILETYNLTGSWKAFKAVKLTAVGVLSVSVFHLFKITDWNLGARLFWSLREKKTQFLSQTVKICGRRPMTALCAVRPMNFDIRKRIDRRKRCWIWLDHLPPFSANSWWKLFFCNSQNFSYCKLGFEVYNFSSSICLEWLDARKRAVLEIIWAFSQIRVNCVEVLV